ncbi:hypothetical protein JOE27_003480 [Pseudomonas sp. M5]|nr:hypothetical protein [Pseudomonas sp. M5]
MHQAILEQLINAGAQVSLIGDANQGIFAFAGADGMFLKTYADRPGVQEYKLTRNYRSLPPIIAIANRLCGRNDEPDREADQGGAFFIGYKGTQIPHLITAFNHGQQRLAFRLVEHCQLRRIGIDRLLGFAVEQPIPQQLDLFLQVDDLGGIGFVDFLLAQACFVGLKQHLLE